MFISSAITYMYSIIKLTLASLRELLLVRDLTHQYIRTHLILERLHRSLGDQVLIS